MGCIGNLSAKVSLENQIKKELKARADFLSSQLSSPKYEDKMQEVIDRYGISDGMYAWVVSKDKKIIAYPSDIASLKPHDKEQDEKIVGKLISEGLPPIKLEKKRMIFVEKLPRGNFLVVSANLSKVYSILANYVKFTVYSALALIFISLVGLMLLSKEVLKPLYALQEYAKNVSVGEILDKAESFKGTEVYPIASTIERLYMQSHKDKSLDQNPLSGLPGNKSLYDALFRRIDAGKQFAVGFVDANNFTAYNNKYGFEKGDSVIRFIGMTILNAIREKGNREDKIYHLGGDRFIFITTPDKVKEICEKIIKDYDRQIVYYYDEEAQQQGYIVSTDKHGKTGEFPFMPICIGVATNLRRPLIHPLQIGHIVGEIRNYLRQRQKSDYLIDRRRTEIGRAHV